MNPNHALILVDLQNDFLPGGALAVPDGDAVIPVVNRLIEGFPLVVATQDWHPPGHASFASQHPGKSPMDEGEVGGHRQTLWPDHCVRGSEGAEFAPGLDTTRCEVIFRKGTRPEIDSYSGFYDLGHDHDTGLAACLRGKGVETVFLAGLAADICVKFTALDALAEGFRTRVIRDATRAVELEQGDGERAFEEVREKGGEIVESSGIGATSEP